MGKVKKPGQSQQCRCCLKEFGLKGLWTEYYNGDEREVYGEMVNDCFALPWEPESDKMESICEGCVNKLRDAVSFKREILYSDQLLKQLAKNDSQDNVKQEEESDAEIETEYLSLEYLDDDDKDKTLLEIKLEQESKAEASIKQEDAPPSKRAKRYTEEDLKKCLEAVTSGTLSQTKAAYTYRVPRKTVSAALAETPTRSNVKLTYDRDVSGLKKRQANLDNLIRFTNATPFRDVRKGHICYFCNAELDDAAQLKTHTIEKHLRVLETDVMTIKVISAKSVKLDVTDLTCEICGDNLPTLESAFDHLRIKHEVGIHTDSRDHLVPFQFDGITQKCVVCAEEFLSFNRLNDHINLKHYKNYECEKCGRGFICKASLQAHANTHQTGVYPCKHCPEVFTVRTRLWHHERYVHLNRKKCNKCLYCDEKFLDSVTKQKHQSEAHGVARLTFKCGSCEKVYCSRTGLQRHIQGYHLMLRPHKCTECGSSFAKRHVLKTHMLRHTGVKSFQCDVCKKSYGRRSTLTEHLRIHANDRKYKCEHCGKRFVQKCSWRGHMWNKHKENPGKAKTVQKKRITNNPKKRERSKHMDNITTLFHHTNATPLRCQKDIGYGCCFCEKFYEKPAELKEHTRQTHQSDIKNIMRKKSLNDYHVKLDITDLQCSECDTKIDNLEDMMRHLQEHNKNIHWDINNHIMPFSFEDDELRCVICKAEFNKFKKLNEHLNKHYRNRVCDVCGAGFINERTFRKHLIQVHKKGVFTCKFCQKVFDTIGKKRSHESSVHIHSQMLNKCGYCNKKFKSHRNKEKHISTVHGVRLKEIKCKLCGKVCLTANALRVHTRRDHLKERNYQCHLCDFSSYGNSCLRNHMLKHTGVRDFQCDVCLKSYGKKKTLKEHMRIHADDRRFKCEYCGLAFIQKCSLKGHMQSKHRDIVPSV